MEIPGLANFRDLGGIPASDGGRVRSGRLYRSSALNRLSPEGMAAIRALGLRMVLDLRDGDEFDAWGYNLGDGGVRRVSLPVLGGLPVPPDLEGVYVHMVENRGADFTTAVRALAAEDALPALVHCAAGKDRTGLAIALTLSAAGVSDDAIIEDYFLSNAGLGLVEPGPGTTYDPYQAGRYVYREYIADALARARRLGGDVPGYLAMHGMTDDELSALREALVEAVNR